MTMRIYGLNQARAKLGDIADDTDRADRAAVLTRWDRPVAVLVSPAWYEAHRGEDDPSLSLIAPAR